MKKEITNKREYQKAEMRLVIFDYKEIVMASGKNPGVDDAEEEESVVSGV